MRSKTLLTATLALLAIVLSGQVMAQAGPTPGYTENGFNPRMLDAGVSKAERMKLFAYTISLANSGQVRAQDLAGTMYWQGSSIAGSPVATNLAQARILLANAAIHGDVMAMAKLGELELAAGRKPQAMVWAQLYARYLNPMALQRSARGRGSAYAADLIKRITDAGGKIDKATRANVAIMIKRYDKSIRRGIDAFNDQDRKGRTFLTREPGPTQFDPPDITNENGVVEYMIGFDEDGKAQKVWQLASFPDAALGPKLRDYLNVVLSNTADKGSGMRYLNVTITHNSKRYSSLRPVH